MNNEWDNINNDPIEEIRSQRETDVDTLFSSSSSVYSAWSDMGPCIHDVIRSEELVRISAEEGMECRRHGRVQSMSIHSTGRRSHPRTVTVCLHCFMDLLVQHCGAEDSLADRRHEEYRREMERMMLHNSGTFQTEDREYEETFNGQN